MSDQSKCTCPDGPPHKGSCPLAGQVTFLPERVGEGPGGLPPKWSEPLSSPASRARREARQHPWAEKPAIHTQDVIVAALAIGERTFDDEGEYTGLTHARIVELLKELGELRGEREQLQSWLIDNMNLREEDKDGSPVTAAIQCLYNLKGVIATTWPHLVKVWENMSYAMRQAKMLPPEQS